MKTKLIAIAMLSILLGCSPESDVNTSSLDIDFTQIVNPDTVKADAQFDTSKNGIYRGVFAALDGTHHGKLTINAGNNTKFDALLELNNGVKYGFKSLQGNLNDITAYEGPQGNFVLNTQGEKAIIEAAVINNLEARATIFKETSQSKIMMSLGTFQDSSDPAFGGTWDLISTTTTSITVPTGQSFPLPSEITVDNVNIIDEIVVMKNGGATFTDNMMEDFTPGAGCGSQLPPGSQAPFYTGAQTITVIIFGIPQSFEIDEWAMSNQTSTFAGQDANWTLNFSLFQGNQYFDGDCNETPNGGSWNWAGRNGTILID